MCDHDFQYVGISNMLHVAFGLCSFAVRARKKEKTAILHSMLEYRRFWILEKFKKFAVHGFRAFSEVVRFSS